MVVVGRREDVLASSLAARRNGYEQSYHSNFVGRWLSSYIAFILIYWNSVTASGGSSDTRFVDGRDCLASHHLRGRRSGPHLYFPCKNRQSRSAPGPSAAARSNAPCGSATRCAKRHIWSRKRGISTCVPQDDFSGILASRSCQNSPAGASPKRPNRSLSTG